MSTYPSLVRIDKSEIASIPIYNRKSSKENKKPKMDMHDAELFVDRIKVRGTFLNLRVEWVSSQWRMRLMCSIVVVVCAAATLRAIPGEVREILANPAGK